MRGLLATPLAAWERDGVKTALAKVGLPADDVDDPRHMFWRFETATDVPVGFGGLEIHPRTRFCAPSSRCLRCGWPGWAAAWSR